MRKQVFKFLILIIAHILLPIERRTAGEATPPLQVNIQFKNLQSNVKADALAQPIKEPQSIEIETVDGDLFFYKLERNTLSLPEQVPLVTFHHLGPDSQETKYVTEHACQRYILLQGATEGQNESFTAALKLDIIEGNIEGCLEMNNRIYDMPALPMTSHHKGVSLVPCSDFVNSEMRAKIDEPIQPPPPGIKLGHFEKLHDHHNKFHEKNIRHDHIPNQGYSSSNKKRKRALKRREVTDKTIELSTKYIGIYFVIDHLMFNNECSNSTDKGVSLVIQLVNQIDSYYKRELNTRLVLLGVEVWNASQRIDIQPTNDAQDILNDFRKYSASILQLPGVDNAQLLTGVTSFKSKSTLGLAWVGTTCHYEQYSQGISRWFDPSITQVSVVVGHEIAHNLGIHHDGTTKAGCKENIGCAFYTGSCIMSPYVPTITPTHFSSCSKRQYQEFLKNPDTLQACFLDKPVVLREFQLENICGNGVVDPGEQCDCGAPYFCLDKCCNPDTCKLKEEAVCTPLHGKCCTDQCTIETKSVVCRPAVDSQCDIEERCDGVNTICPEDKHKLEFYPCDVRENGHCIDGKCMSTNIQCNQIWGGNAESASGKCFGQNADPNSPGNCGFGACPVSSVMCGTLHCKVSEQDYKNGPVQKITGYDARKVRFNSQGEHCTFFEDWDSSLKKHIGLVHDGTPCSSSAIENGYCMSQNCIAIPNKTLHLIEKAKSAGDRISEYPFFA